MKTPLQEYVDKSGVYDSPIGQILKYIDGKIHLYKAANVEFKNCPDPSNRNKDFSDVIVALENVRHVTLKQMKDEKIHSTK